MVRIQPPQHHSGKADHPISIRPHPKRVVVTFAGKTIADTRDAMALFEADYPPVMYIPRDDVAMSLLERTSHTTHCPYKGDASYFTINAGGKSAENVVWSYERPYPAALRVASYMAFYSDRVEIEER